MHIKHIHETLEKLSAYAYCEACKPEAEIDTKELGCVVDMVKDLCCAEKDAYLAKSMKEDRDEEEAEEKYMLRKLKEEYGEEEGERRYYDDYRYADGRFAPKGKGTYRGRGRRRGYAEPDYNDYFIDWDGMQMSRDMDRPEYGRMYYPDADIRSNTTNIDSAERGTTRDSKEGKSGMSRRSYMESKELHKANSPQDKDAKMKELEKYMKELSEDVTEMIEGATAEEKTMLKTKLSTLVTKL